MVSKKSKLTIATPILVKAIATCNLYSTTVFIPLHYSYVNLQQIKNSKTSCHKEKDTLSKETTQERSVRRSRKEISRIVKGNPFQLWGTLTIKADRNDSERSRRKIKDWIKNQQRQYGHFEYIYVAEYHKDKKALHFHILLLGYKGELTPAFSPKTGKRLTKWGQPLYNLGSYKSGLSSVSFIPQEPQAYERICNYLRKYITKDIPSVYDRHRYFASHGLDKSPQKLNPSNFYSKIKADWWLPIASGVLLGYNQNIKDLEGME